MGRKLIVLVKPNAKRNRIINQSSDIIEVQIAAPPKNGKANKELLKLLKSKFKHVRIISGFKKRRKIIEVE